MARKSEEYFEGNLTSIRRPFEEPGFAGRITPKLVRRSLGEHFEGYFGGLGKHFEGHLKAILEALGSTLKAI